MIPLWRRAEQSAIPSEQMAMARQLSEIVMVFCFRFECLGKQLSTIEAETFSLGFVDLFFW